MRLVVVGGQSRSVGKTAAICSLVAAFPAISWTAVKITQFGHGVCGRTGDACDCACDGDTWDIQEERNRHGRKDTSRFLAAGARRVLWVRTRVGQLGAALPSLWDTLDRDDYVICESNSLVAFRRPDVYVTLLDAAVADFKPSARAALAGADAWLLAGSGSPPAIAPTEATPAAFAVFPPTYISPKLVAWLAPRITS